LVSQFGTQAVIEQLETIKVDVEQRKVAVC